MKPHRKDDILTEDNVLSVDFKAPRKALITGGPSGPENWLSTLEDGTIFLTKKNAERGADMLYQYLVLEHLTKSTKMIWALPDGKTMEIWVDTLDFSRKHTLHEVAGIIGLPGKQEEQEQVTYEQVQSPVPGVDGTSGTSPPEDGGTRS